MHAKHFAFILIILGVFASSCYGHMEGKRSCQSCACSNQISKMPLRDTLNGGAANEIDKIKRN